MCLIRRTKYNSDMSSISYFSQKPQHSLPWCSRMASLCSSLPENGGLWKDIYHTALCLFSMKNVLKKNLKFLFPPFRHCIWPYRWQLVFLLIINKALSSLQEDSKAPAGNHDTNLALGLVSNGYGTTSFLTSQALSRSPFLLKSAWETLLGPFFLKAELWPISSSYDSPPSLYNKVAFHRHPKPASTAGNYEPRGIKIFSLSLQG